MNPRIVCMLSAIVVFLVCGGCGHIVFEPPYDTCYNWNNKFEQPPLLHAPQIRFPHAMRHRGITGEVAVVVVLSPSGSAEQLRILYDTTAPDLAFSTAVIDGLKEARWTPQKKHGTWFYYKVVFDYLYPDEKIVRKPDTVYDFLCSDAGCDYSRMK